MPEHGPFATERQVRETAAVRSANAAFDADPGAGKHISNHLRILTDACEAAGVELGAYDSGVLAWLANWEPETCAAIAGLIRRAAQPPEGTVTEWGVRPRDTVLQYLSEEMARKLLPQVRRAYCEPEAVVVSRQVTPWTEAPEPAEDEDHG